MNLASNSIPTENQIAIFKSDDDQISFNVNVLEENVWLTQKQMAILFEKSHKTISEHINNIFREGELNRRVVVRKFQTTTEHGAIADRTQIQEVNIYNLDVIISVGYRVKSQRGTYFRQWATKVLKQYLINGYAVNEARIKQIESSLDQLASSHKIIHEDMAEIKDLLSKLSARPIIIQSHSHHNHQIRLGNNLEKKLVKLLDKILPNIDDKKTQTKLNKVKKDLNNLPHNSKSKNNILSFLKEMGDEKSNIHKTIKGAGITKNVITEIVKIGEKLKDLFG